MPDYNTVSQPSYSSSTDLTDDPFKDFGEEIKIEENNQGNINKTYVERR